MFFSFHHWFFYKLGNMFNVLIICLNPNSLGNAVEEIRFSIIKAKKENKKLIFFFCKFAGFYTKQKVVDPEILKLTNEYTCIKYNSFFYRAISIFFSLFFLVEKIIYKFYFKLFNKSNGYYYRPMIGQDIIWRPNPDVLNYNLKSLQKNSWNKEINNFNFKIPKKIINEFKKKIKYLGLPKDSWFVCLHCRSGLYRKDWDNANNINIENYYPSIRYITEKKGGYVIILGDQPFKDIKKFKNVINYPAFNHRSILMDFVLIKYCKFYIGGGSGPTDIAMLLKKKYLFTNSQSWVFGIGALNNSLTLWKNAFSKSKNRILKIDELLSDNFRVSENKDGWICDDLIMLQNTKKEILDSVKKMFQKKIKPNKVNKKLEKSFKNLIKYFKWDNADNLENVNYWYRMSKTSNMFNIKGNLGNHLKK